jgi:glycosyltransferase involved in cell wall biosynthesis
MAKPKVLILHNVISFYRLPVFEEINRHADTEVWFTRHKTADRKWDTSLEGHNFPAKVLPSWILGPLFINPTLLFELIRKRYDIYLVGDFPETMLATFLTILVAKIRHKPVILWSETVNNEVNYYQGLVVSPSRMSRLVRTVATAMATTYRRILLSLPSQFIALSQDASAFLRRQGIQPERITTGIQVMPKSFLPKPTIPKTKSQWANHFTVLYVGYLNPAKAVDDLISACKQIDNPNLRLVIVGSGPDEARLHELAGDDARIEFTGYISDPSSKANYYAAADVMVLPTLVDCWGLVINEAMHYGVPTITTTDAAARELVADGKAGCAVPSRNPRELAAAITRLMNDPKLRASMSKAATDRRDITDFAVGAAPILQAIKKTGAMS